MQGDRPMLTECNTREFDFQGLGRRMVTARFDGGAVTSDAGGLPLGGGEAPAGAERRWKQARGKSLAGKSTLNRLELTPTGADTKSRYKKIVARHRDIESFFVETFLALPSEPPEEIVTD